MIPLYLMYLKWDSLAILTVIYILIHTTYMYVNRVLKICTIYIIPKFVLAYVCYIGSIWSSGLATSIRDVILQIRLLHFKWDSLAIYTQLVTGP